LPLDALDGSDGNILSGMRYCHDLLSVWMHEVMVTAGRSEMDSSGIAQLPDDRPTVHRLHDVVPPSKRQAA
jgi:hypothetical protein